MTPLAEFAEFATMGVLILVAFDAFRWRHFVLFQRVQVASQAIKTDMLPIKDKFALPVVVKGPEFPSVRVVTIAAFCSQTLLVGIFRGMTG